jgi:hypothetical protein
MGMLVMNDYSPRRLFATVYVCRVVWYLGKLNVLALQVFSAHTQVTRLHTPVFLALSISKI